MMYMFSNKCIISPTMQLWIWRSHAKFHRITVVFNSECTDKKISIPHPHDNRNAKIKGKNETKLEFSGGGLATVGGIWSFLSNNTIYMPTTCSMSLIPLKMLFVQRYFVPSSSSLTSRKVYKLIGKNSTDFAGVMVPGSCHSQDWWLL